MNVIKWFLWRRWLLIRNTRNIKMRVEVFLTNCWKINLGWCRDHPVIWNDMQKIIRERDKRSY